MGCMGTTARMPWGVLVSLREFITWGATGIHWMPWDSKKETVSSPRAERVSS